MKMLGNMIPCGRSALSAAIGICSLIGLACAGYSQTKTGKDSTKVDDIKKLLTVSGAADSLTKRFRESGAQGTSPVSNGESQQIVQTGEPIQNRLTEAQVSIYEEHFTQEEIRELIRFYESPLGLKLLAEMPKISLQEAEVLKIWQQRVASGSQEVLEAGKKTAPSRTFRYTEEQRRAMLRYNGFDPDMYTFDETTGTIAPKPQPEPKPIQLPKEVRFIIEVRDSSGSKTTYYSKTEPKPYGSGFKFQMYPTDVEITVSDPVTIFKLP